MTDGVVVATAILSEERAAVVAQIRAIAATEPLLSPRGAARLLRAIRAGRLAVARVDGDVVGWFLAEGGRRTVPELGFLFVAAPYRNGDVFRRLLELLLVDSPIAVAVTFQPGFAVWLTRSFGFRRSTLAEVNRLTRGAFVRRRLTPTRLLAVARHTSAAAPIYLVYGARPDAAEATA